MSTIAPATARRLASAAATHGATMLDAPVSGGEIGAIDGTLSIMVGGDAAALERVRPVLEAMGNPERIIHIGESGAGQICKACNQLVIGGTLAAVGEAFALARKSGVDPGEGPRGAARWFCRQPGARSSRRTAADRRTSSPGFRRVLYRKDLRIVMDALERRAGAGAGHGHRAAAADGADGGGQGGARLLGARDGARSDRRSRRSSRSSASMSSRWRRRDVDRDAVRRMRKRETPRVQRLACDSPRSALHAVGGVADDRPTLRGQVHADLVHAAGDQPAADAATGSRPGRSRPYRSRLNFVTLGTPPRSRTVTRRVSHGSRSSARSIVPLRRRLAGDDGEIVLFDAVGRRQPLQRGNASPCSWRRAPGPTCPCRAG